MNIELQHDYEPQFSGFRDLMKRRVREILVLSSLYDNFVIEEDVAISEKIFSEYIGLNLYFVPRIRRVSTAAEAFQALKEHSFDIVITMPRIIDMDPFEFGRRVKEIKEDMLVFLLSYNTVELERFSKRINKRGIDRIFYWSGDSRILLAIVKYVEDLFNCVDDSKSGTRIILMVEDNPVYYSSLLSVIYTEVMTQTRLLISESLNDFHRMLRMRARPKIMLAETYEEAIGIYENYKNNILGVISDLGFPRERKLDPKGGLKLLDKIKAENVELPILLHSSDESKKDTVKEKNVTFLYKNSYSFHKDIRDFMLNNFGFGDFIFRFPDGREVDRAKNLQDMALKLKTIPRESFEYHTRRDHISTWLMARTEFEVAKKIKPTQISDFRDIEEAREYLSSSILSLIETYQQGVIADFKRSHFDPENIFVKLGNGSFGGKGRCIAFINLLLAKADNLKKYEHIVDIKTPRTTAICTDVFEEFLERNQLRDFAIKCNDDNEITDTFLKSPLPEKIQADLYAFLDKIHHPIAVRSSSLLEDSHSLPFAGIYNTYVLPNNHSSNAVRLKQLSDAIKLVYASTFFQSPKAYATNTSYRIEEQKMAVIIQQLVGEQYGDIFYPIISGVAQSYNFYPFSHMNPEDGIAHLALGLGKTVVEGGRIYSFSPAYPRLNPIHASPAEFMKKSQSYFYALNMGERIEIV